MENYYWSTYVQESAELYHSRSLRFHDGNRDLWLKALQIEDGMRVLEVGCGSGIFCHRIKSYLPGVKITGLDRDTGHIEFARAKAEELSLDCEFVNGDASSLPFGDNSFDLCFSHTVFSFCDPDLFVNEQRRVLKPGGKMAVACIIHGGHNQDWTPTENCEEKELFDKLWTEAEKNENCNIKRYETDETRCFEYLHKYGFKDISAEAIAALKYAPDCANVSDEMAEAQINDGRITELSSVEKARRLAPDCLSPEEFASLLEMINRRFDKRIDQYRRGEKLWDWYTGTVLVISGTK